MIYYLKPKNSIHLKNPLLGSQIFNFPVVLKILQFFQELRFFFKLQNFYNDIERIYVRNKLLNNKKH